MTVDIYGADRDQRLLATILLDGNDINLAMIEAGLAGIHWGPESGNPYQPQYQLAEQAARRLEESPRSVRSHNSLHRRCGAVCPETSKT